MESRKLRTDRRGRGEPSFRFGRHRRMSFTAKPGAAQVTSTNNRHRPHVPVCSCCENEAFDVATPRMRGEATQQSAAPPLRKSSRQDAWMGAAAGRCTWLDACTCFVSAVAKRAVGFTSRLGGNDRGGRKSEHQHHQKGREAHHRRAENRSDVSDRRAAERSLCCLLQQPVVSSAPTAPPAPPLLG